MLPVFVMRLDEEFVLINESILCSRIVIRRFSAAVCVSVGLVFKQETNKNVRQQATIIFITASLRVINKFWRVFF